MVRAVLFIYFIFQFWKELTSYIPLAIIYERKVVSICVYHLYMYIIFHCLQVS